MLLIQTPTPAIKQSKDFYQRLGFTTISEEPYRVSDGKVVIEVNPDRFTRAGVVLYRDSWAGTVVALRQLVPVIQTDTGYLLDDLSGTRISLIEAERGPVNTENNHSPSSIIGNFAGLSLEVIDIADAVKVWELLGFEKTMGSAEKGWVSYQNEDGLGISFMKPNMCPHLFFNPSLTYFNSGKNLEVIEKIRAVGVPITEEITVFNEEGIVDNVILRDPGGYGFFVFND
jgi:hypothetical protein